MVTLVSQISNYFEQFNSTLASHMPSTSHDHLSVDRQSPMLYYVFDFEVNSDRAGTLYDLRTFMIKNWHRSIFYAFIYLCFIYGKIR
jgi:hypothetical protein